MRLRNELILYGSCKVSTCDAMYFDTDTINDGQFMQRFECWCNV